jgi:urease beta subunit
MVALSIQTDFGDVQRRLDAMRSDVADRVLKRSMDRTIEQGRSEMTRQITGEFNIKAGKVREKLFVRKASFKGSRFELEAVLTSRDKSGRRRGINLINFAGRQTKAGLTFKIKKNGGRSIIKRGFIGNKGRTAFARVGAKRLPIKGLTTIDVPQMFNTRRINAKVVKKIRDVFPTVFEREAAFAVSRFNASR